MNKKRAFTLIEILVVVTIIGLLAAAGVTSYTQLGKQSRDARRKTDIENIRAALEMYKSDNSSYPQSLDNLTVSTVYLKTVPTDPRGNNYSYSPSPAACSGNCTSYSLSIMLDSGDSYIADPYGALSATPTPYHSGPLPPQ
jgi:general secretion pathway protein G